MNRANRPAGLLALMLTGTLLAPPAHAQGSWVSLDNQPAGTPAQLTFDAQNSDLDVSRGNLHVSGFWVTLRQGPGGVFYHEIVVPGLPNVTQTGAPRLPECRFRLGLLSGAQAASQLQAPASTTFYIPGIHAWPEPIEAEFHEGTPEQFARDDQIYSSQGFWPPPQAPFPAGSTGIAGVLPAAECTLNPFRWDPGSDVLEAHMDTPWVLGHAGSAPNPALIPRTMRKFLSHSVLNWNAIAPYLAPDPTHYSGYFLFLYPAAYMSAIQPLVLQKKARGFSVTEMTRESFGLGCPFTLDAIKGWLRTTPTDADHFCILVGGASQMPLCTSPPACFFPGGVPTDDEYGNPWDITSLEKVVLVGRVPGRTPTDVIYSVSRILKYEDDPVPDGRYEKVVLVAHKDDVGSTHIYSWQEDVRTASYAVPPTFVTQYGTDFGVTNASLTNEINAGVGLVAYLGHSDRYNWWHWDIPVEDFNVVNTSTLANAPRSPVVWSFSCEAESLTASSECLGESWMRSGGDGAVSFYGGTVNVQVGATVVLDKVMFDELYNHDNTLQGYTIYAGEQRMETAAHSGDAWKYTLLGDPQMTIRRANPPLLIVPMPEVVPIPCPAGGCKEIHLHVFDGLGAPISGAKAGAWMAGAAASAPGSGAAGALRVHAQDAVADNRYTDAQGLASIPADGLHDGLLYYSVETEDGASMMDSVRITNGVASASAGAAAMFRFKAFPAIASGPVRFEFGRALERQAEVRIYDVAGRRVRSLAAAAGSAYAPWDGRDAAGARVAPGVYLARFADGDLIHTCRIVMLR
jgi:hypothetical protein